MPSRVTESAEFTREEMLQAQRCHSMHAEGLRYPVTPIGMHYLLIHYDIPHSGGKWPTEPSLSVGTGRGTSNSTPTPTLPGHHPSVAGALAALGHGPITWGLLMSTR